MARTATWGNRFWTTRALIAAAAGLLLLLIVIAFAPGRAAGAVIGFDDLDAPPIGGQGLTVNVQYGDDHGVTFNDLDAFDYPAASRTRRPSASSRASGSSSARRRPGRTSRRRRTGSASGSATTAFSRSRFPSR